MKRFATLCLVSGIFIMMLALGVAVFAMTDTDNSTKLEPAASSTDTCLFCHVDVHDNWKLISSPDLEQPALAALEAPSQSAIAPPPDQLCGNCHLQTSTIRLSPDEIGASINGIQERVAALRADLTRIFDHYAARWDTNAYMSDKPARQIVAERISTLIAVIEADGSWGFHNPDYTEEILTEAETLMAQMLNDMSD